MGSPRSLSAVEAVVQRDRRSTRWLAAGLIGLFLFLLAGPFVTGSVFEFGFLLFLIFLGILAGLIRLYRDAAPVELTKTELVKYRISQFVRFLSAYNEKFDDSASRRSNKRRALRQAAYLLRNVGPFIPIPDRPHLPRVLSPQARIDLFVGEVADFGIKIQHLVYLLAGVLRAKRKVPPGVIPSLEQLLAAIEAGSHRLEEVHLRPINEAISFSEKADVPVDPTLGASFGQRAVAWFTSRFEALSPGSRHVIFVVVASAGYVVFVAFVPPIKDLLSFEVKFLGYFGMLAVVLMVLGLRK